MAVAMMALEAVGAHEGPKGEREIALNEFYLVPGSTPDRETVLVAGRVDHVGDAAAGAAGTKSYYLKLRDRQQYEFALASAAVLVRTNGGHIEQARIALGGVATKPWRSREAEQALEGQPATAENFRKAADAAMAGAKPLRDNGFKIELAKRAIVRALTVVTQAGGQA